MRIGDSDISLLAPVCVFTLVWGNECKFISIGGGGAGKPLACRYRPVQRDRTRKDCLWAWLTLRPAEVARLGALGQREGSAGGGGRMLLVTGGAGCIGANLVAGLYEAGRADIVVDDPRGKAGKWRNLRQPQLRSLVPARE